MNKDFAKISTDVFHYMNMLGYKDFEIKSAIEFFNLHHTLDVYCYELPLIIGKLVQIIERGYCYYETY